MSAGKLDTSGIFESFPSPRPPFAVSSRDVRVHKGGIEFRTAAPIPKWTEMTVDMEVPQEDDPVHGRGIVVACNGSRQAGYTVSLVLLSLSRQSQTRLSALV